MMHTIIASECTGCELCVPRCPVDCISMVARRRDWLERPHVAITVMMLGEISLIIASVLCAVAAMLMNRQLSPTRSGSKPSISTREADSPVPQSSRLEGRSGESAHRAV